MHTMSQSLSLMATTPCQLRQQSNLKIIAHGGCLQVAFALSSYPIGAIFHLSISWLIVEIVFAILESIIYLFQIKLSVFELGVSIFEFVFYLFELGILVLKLDLIFLNLLLKRRSSL